MSGEKDRMNINDGLVDRGWAQMHEILDKEMPQRKRRGLVWWMLAGFILLGAASVLGYQSWQNQENDLELSELETGSAFESRDNGETAISQKHEIQFEQAGKEAEAEPTQPLHDAKESLVVAPNQELVKTASVKEFGGQKRLEVLEKPPATSRERSIIQTSDVPSMSVIKDSLTEVAVERMSTASRVPVASVGRLASRQLSLLVRPNLKIEGRNMDDESSTISRQKNRITFDAALRADLLSDFNFEKINAGGGIELQLGLGTRVRLITGLSYWRLATNRMIYASQNSLAADEVFTSDCCDATVSNELAADVDLDKRFLLSGGQPDRFHMLEIPLQVSYAISPRWDLHLGAHWISLLSEVSNASADMERSASPGRQPFEAQEDKSLYRRSNVAFALGGRYRFHRHFFLDLRLSMASQQYLTYSVSEDSAGSAGNLHNRIRLGVGYRFGSR